MNGVGGEQLEGGAGQARWVRGWGPGASTHQRREVRYNPLESQLPHL